jgi:putative transcriptional regulator
MAESVHNSVQKYRLKHDLTQEELGDAVGVTRQTIIAIEKSNYTPSVLLALKLARFFHVKVEQLFTFGG